MSTSLLVEYIPFKPIGKINEDMGAQFGVPGGLVVQGVLQRAGAKNQNGRVYPKNILNPLSILRYLWRKFDFDGFYGVILEKDDSISKRYQNW